jgi:CelD/BcsL family acetyltransferase involved in cellulose biosynthesis
MTDAHVRVFDDVDAAATVWCRLEKDGHLTSSYQRFAWLGNWQRHIGRVQGVRPALVLVEGPHGEPWMLLPLGVRKVGLARVLSWLGGDITGYHGPLIAGSCPSELLGADFPALWWRAMREVPAFDYVHLERQPPKVGTLNNPCLQLGESISAFSSPVLDLSDEWSEEYPLRASRKSRETDRRKVRRMAQHGDVEFVVAKDAQAADRIIDALVVQKSRWLGEQGLADLFGDGSHERFLRHMARAHADLLHISAITVGGKIWATHWALACDGTFYYWFASYEEGELTRFSPGDMLVRSLMEWSTNHDIHVFDFGVGSQAYKNRWADRHVPLHECVLPRSGLGRLYVIAARTNRWLRRTIKESPRVLAVANGIRVRFYGRKRTSRLGDGKPE